MIFLFKYKVFMLISQWKFFKKKYICFGRTKKKHYLCIVDVGNTTENKDVSTPI
jgi:hypothetical protein